jgi:peroxiredoxin
MLVSLVVLFLGWANLSSEPETINVGERAKAFTLPRLRTDAKFNSPVVSLQQLFGKIIVLHFWAAWCKSSTEELTALDRLQKQYGPEKMVVVAVNVDDEQKQALQFLKHQALNVLALYDEHKDVAGIYDVPRMPSSFIIDGNGLIRFIHCGFTEADVRNYELEIEGLLSETGSRWHEPTDVVK